MASALCSPLLSRRGLAFCPAPGRQQLLAGRNAGAGAPAAQAGRRRRHHWRRRSAQTEPEVAAITELSVEDLRAGLAEAIKAEDYASAARIRDRLQQHPLFLAEEQLAAAVREERWEDAARLRDRLAELRPPPPPPPPQPAFDTTATTASDTTTDGIRVTCRSFYVPTRSAPDRGYFFYAYDIQITNNSQETVKVMERYWQIHDGRGQMQEVRGSGVVGEQPELEPGQSFQYQSFCPLPTPKGSMEGHYEVYAKDKATGQWRRSFLAMIGQFHLRADI